MMAITTTRNRPSSGICSNCRNFLPVVSWTLYSDGGGMGWQGSMPIRLCQGCMREQADTLDGAEFIDVYVNRLKAANIPVPRNPTLEALRNLCRATGLQVDGDGTTRPANVGTIRWWEEKALASNVPLLVGVEMTKAEIEERINLWAEAEALGIDVWAEMTNADVRAVVDASRAAKAGAPQGQPPASGPTLPDTPPSPVAAPAGPTPGADDRTGQAGGSEAKETPAPAVKPASGGNGRRRTAPIGGRIVPD